MGKLRRLFRVLSTTAIVIGMPAFAGAMPDPTAGGWTECAFRVPCLIRSGSIEAAVEGPRAGSSAAMRVIAPFDLGSWENGTIRVPLRVDGPVSDEPVRLEIERILVDTPVGADTLPASAVVRSPAAGGVPGRMAASATFDAAVEPLWRPGDGEVLVVSRDDLNDALTPLLDDLTVRGFRWSRARLSLIMRDYGEQEPQEAIRAAVADACRNFSTRPLALILVGTASEDVPGDDLLPTFHRTYEHEFPDEYDDTYAEDAGFGDLLVGRIPVRTSAQLAAYVSKLTAYRTQPALPRVHFVVGDAAINRDNADRRRSVGELIGLVQDGGLLQATARYASAYMPILEAANRARALSDLHADLAQGVGILAVFGNNVGATNLAHAWEVPPGSLQPWLVPSDMPTVGRLPIALFGTCLNGAFDEDQLFPGFDSPAETWVREPERGVIAAIAPSHLTTFFDDWEIEGQFLRRLGQADGSVLGAAVVGMRESLLREWTRGNRSMASVRMINLLGDPLLMPRLGIDQVRLAGTFESSGTWPTQGVVESGRGWTTSDCASGTVASRVVEADGGVQTLERERMMRLSARFGTGSSRRGVAWKLFACDLLVQPGSVLRGWIRKEQGMGRLGFDAVTSDGRLLSDDLLDIRGVQMGPGSYPPRSAGRWSPVTVRLDRWAGHRIRALYVRYEARACNRWDYSDSGRDSRRCAEELAPESVLAFVDGVSIEPEATQPFLDGAFEEDADADGRPDAWTAPWPASLQGAAAGGSLLLDDGDRSLVLAAGESLTNGISQLLVSQAGKTRLQLGWTARSTDGGTLRVALVDPYTGECVDAATFGPIEGEWLGQGVDLNLPRERPVLLELRPLVGTIHLRALRLEEERPQRDESDLPDVSAQLRIEPNPTRGSVAIRWDSPHDEPRRIELFDVAGRRIAAWRPEPRGSDWILRTSELRRDDGRPVGTGIYFLRVECGKSRTTRQIHVVR